MIRAWFSLRLHIQLAIASGLLLAITISITTWLNIQSQQNALIKNTTNEIVSLAKNISIISSYLVITNKLDELEALLIESTSFPTVLETKIISLEDGVLSHVKKQQSGELILLFDLTSEKFPDNLNKSTIIDTNLQQQKMTVWQPIKTSSVVAWLKMDVSLKKVIELRQLAITDNITSASIAIVLDLLILLAILYIPARNFNKVLIFSKHMTEIPGKKMPFTGGFYELDQLIEVLNNTSSEMAHQNVILKQQADNLIALNLKQTQLQKESEQKDLLNFMHESIITIDENGTILSFNKSAEEMFTYTANEVIGNNIVILMPEPYCKSHHNYLENYIQGGQAKIIGTDREVQGKRKDGEVFPMRLTVTELPSDDNGTRRFIGSCQDVTDIKQQEEQLLRSHKMDALGKLAGGIAHDYNNLLGIIRGYAELLNNGLEQPQTELKEYTEEITHAVKRGSKLSDRLLGFSKHKTPRSSIADINALLESQHFLLEKTLASGINIKFVLAENLWMTELDTDDFENSIINIAINSMHAMKTGGNLTFQTKNKCLDLNTAQKLDLTPGNYIELCISDTGIGIKPEIKQRIFDPFFSTKGEFGSGLGLSQVYGLIERSKGSISVDSSPGKGTTFSLYFPKSLQQINPAGSQHNNSEPQIGGSEKILVVDDEPAIVELTNITLTRAGYQVFTATNGNDALTLLQKEKIDLIISDVIMPNMNGYELATRVRELYANIKIQIVTGFTDNLEINTSNEKLHQNRLIKPYTSIRLLSNIRMLLDQKNISNHVDLNGRNILIMDDDEDVRTLFALHLSKLQCKSVLTINAEETFAAYEQAIVEKNPIDVMILDLHIPGSVGGKEVAKTIRETDNVIKLVVTSGNTASSEMINYEEYGFNAAIEKSFNRKSIEKLLQSLLNVHSQ